MAHFASILFFAGVLLALAMILEVIVRDNKRAILAALRGHAPARPSAKAWEVRPRRPHAAS